MQRFLGAILPAKWFAALRDGTREWLVECECGHQRDLWDLGGIRYKARGEPRRYQQCPECATATWHKVRKKTEDDSVSIANP